SARDEARHDGPNDVDVEDLPERMAPLRFATAQVILATGVAAALEWLDHRGDDDRSGSAQPKIAAPLAWAPLVVGPMAAAAGMIHTRSASPRTSAALRLLNGAAIALGGTLVAAELIGSRRIAIHHPASIAF